MGASEASNPLDDAVRRLAADLRSCGVRWAMVGGIAVSVRAEPRFTKDVDAAVAVEDDAGAEGVVRGLIQRRYVVEWELEQKATGRLAGMRLRSPGERGVAVDLLFASCGIEPDVVGAASELEVVPGLRAPVASRGHLIALKTLAVADHRPNDLGDLQALIAGAEAVDLELARKAVGQIEERGYAREKDLKADLEEFVARFSA